MRFFTYDLALDVLRGLREPFAIIRRHDAALARHHFRIALGSMREVGAAIDVAVVHGWLAEAPLDRERDRLCGLLYSLQREKRR